MSSMKRVGKKAKNTMKQPTNKQQLAILNAVYKRLDKQLLTMEQACDRAMKNLDKYLESL